MSARAAVSRATPIEAVSVFHRKLTPVVDHSHYHGHATDIDGDVALLLTRAQGVEVRELMDEIVAELESNDE